MCICETKHDLVEIASQMFELAEKDGFLVNERKTKYLNVTKKDSKPLTVNMYEFEQVEALRHFKGKINSGNDCHKKIQACIKRADTCFKELLKKGKFDKKVPVSDKKSLYLKRIRTKLTSGCETWTTSKQDLNKMDVFERDVLKKVYLNLGNKELMEQYDEHQVSDYVREKRIIFMWHQYKSGNVQSQVKDALGLTVHNKRLRRRPRNRNVEQIKDSEQIAEVDTDFRQ